MPRHAHYSITPLETLQHFGLLSALQLVFLKALRIRSVIVVARNPRVQDWSPDHSYDIRRAGADDAGLFEAAGFSRDTLLQKLDEGPGWLCVTDGRLLAWNFLGTQQTMLADWLLLRTDRPGAIWGTGTWVCRDHRGSGLAKQLRWHAGKWCESEGCDELAGWIELTNHSSRRSSEKLGVRTIGRITFVRLFGLALVHDGHRFYLGRWTAARPLALSLESVRLDRAEHRAGQAAAAPRSKGLPGHGQRRSR